MDGKSLLQYEELCRPGELQDICIEQALLLEPISRRRKYSFINRKPKMIVKSLKKVNQVLLSAVQLVSAIDCCAKRCCQYANQDKIVAMRNE